MSLVCYSSNVWYHSEICLFLPHIHTQWTLHMWTLLKAHLSQSNCGGFEESMVVTHVYYSHNHRPRMCITTVIVFLLYCSGTATCHAQSPKHWRSVQPVRSWMLFRLIFCYYFLVLTKYISVFLYLIPTISNFHKLYFLF